MQNRNYDTIFKRLRYLWNNEILDRCCVSVTAPKDPANPYREQPPSSSEDLYKWYTDGEWILKRNLDKISKTYYAGDALPCIFPYFGTGGHAKYIAPSSSIEYAPDTIWIHPCIEDLDRYNYNFDWQTNPVFQKELQLLQYLASEAKGRYFITPPDNCGSYDGLAQLRGNQELLMDFVLNPEGVKKAGQKLVEILKITGDLFFDAIRENNCGGSIHGWMNTRSDGKHLQLQCDLSVMISNEIFQEFIAGELAETAAWLDHAIYHMDGIEQLRHLDSILNIPGIHMIQWVQVAGQPPATECIPHLRKIQQAGKGLVIAITKDQIPVLLENLSPRGLNLLVWADSPDEADRIVQYVETHTDATR